MATMHSIPAQATELLRGPEAAEGAVVPGEEALVPSPHAGQHHPIVLKPLVARVPIELDVAIPVREFRVRNLLALEQGQVIGTRWASGEDIPLSAGDVQLAWSEFEVVDTQLAVRITRLP
jgi:flagellar motor switch protein FliM